eukprot:4680184-Prymnesium_polylepis.1
MRLKRITPCTCLPETCRTHATNAYIEPDTPVDRDPLTQSTDRQVPARWTVLVVRRRERNATRPGHGSKAQGSRARAFTGLLTGHGQQRV